VAISVDAATVARVNNLAGNGTTGSFTPASGSLLVVCIGSDSNTTEPTFTVSGGSLTWTEGVKISGNVSTTSDGCSQMFTAPVGVGASMTVNVQNDTGFGLSFKTYIVTGQHATAPRGAQGSGRFTADPATLTLYTSTADNSVAIYSAFDWNVDATPPTSSDTADTFAVSGIDSGLSAFKSATATSGSSVTGNYNGTGAADGSFVALEILPDGGGGGGGVVDTTDHHVSTLSFPCLCRKPANDTGWTRGQGGLWIPRKAA
jgi:hypothetical protein